MPITRSARPAEGGLGARRQRPVAPVHVQRPGQARAPRRLQREHMPAEALDDLCTQPKDRLDSLVGLRKNDCLQCRQVTRPVERATLYLGASRRCPGGLAEDPSKGRPKFLHIGFLHITQVKPSRLISSSGMEENFVGKGPAKLLLQAHDLHVNSQNDPASRPGSCPKNGTKLEPAKTES